MGPVLDWIRSCYGGALPDTRLRPRLGSMIKEHGQEHVLVAVGKAQRSGTTIDVLNYIEGILRKQPQGKAAPRNTGFISRRELDAI